MDKFTEQMMQSHPGFREKSEKQKENLGPKDKAFNVTVTHYAKDACKDTLDALAGNLEERMDLLMINGQTLREMIEEKTGNKKPSKEEIENLSCLYVTAALRSEGSVEVFTPYLTSATTKTYRQDPVVIEGSEFEMELDTVIMSLGTSPNPLISSTTEGLEVNKWKCIVASEETGATSKEGVYAGGDAVTGAATVILAMGDGRKAAASMHEELSK